MAFFGPPPLFAGATTTDAGTSGLVPAPAGGLDSRFLSASANFIQPFPLPKYKNTASETIGSMIGGGTATIYAAISPTINVRLFTLIQVPVDGQINNLVFRTSSAPSPAYNVHIALWEIGSDGLPSTLVVGVTGSSGTSLSTDVVFSISSTSLKTGIYYMSITPDATGTASSIRGNSSASANIFRRIFGCSTLETNGNAISYTCLTSYSQTNHETFTVSNLANTPLLGFRYA